MLKNPIEMEMNLSATRDKGREEGDGGWNKYSLQLLPSEALKTRANERMEAIERWMEGFMITHSPYPTSDQEFRGPLCMD